MWSPLVAMATLLSGLSGAFPAKTMRHGQGWKAAGCPPPNVAFNGSVMSLSANERHLADYSQITEVKFVGEVGPQAEKKVCKIKCVGGEWVGPLCHDKRDNGRNQSTFPRCRLEHALAHVTLTYKNATVQGQNISFPHGAELSARCRDLGVYKLVGSSTVTCLNGTWSSRLPTCIPTTALTNFTEDAPPTIVVRVPFGSASAESSGGVLAVYPGSIVHLECLYARKLGNPEWTWTSASKQYLTGWAIAAEEREWKYRLSLYYTKRQDSGVYTCTTPKGLANRINIHVAAIHCDPVKPGDPRVIIRLEGTRIGQLATFHCPVGFHINGTSNLTCRASGQWSGTVPSCTQIVCPRQQPEDPRLSLVEHNTSYGGQAVFRCSWGYKLNGLPRLECQLNGTWSGPVPTCEAVLCPPLLPPINGRLVEDDRHYRAGTTVRFFCNTRYQLVGESNIICTENGSWSHSSPFCKPRCVYPGDPLHGRIGPVKFFYNPGDQLEVSCNPGFVVKLESRPVCNDDGTWSKEVPECLSYTEV